MKRKDVTVELVFFYDRDELCNNGATLQSRALEFMEADLNSQLEILRSQRGMEQEEDDDSKVGPQCCKPVTFKKCERSVVVAFC